MCKFSLRLQSIKFVMLPLCKLLLLHMLQYLPCARTLGTSGAAALDSIDVLQVPVPYSVGSFCCVILLLNVSKECPNKTIVGNTLHNQMKQMDSKVSKLQLHTSLDMCHILGIWGQSAASSCLPGVVSEEGASTKGQWTQSSLDRIYN